MAVRKMTTAHQMVHPADLKIMPVHQTAVDRQAAVHQTAVDRQAAVRQKAEVPTAQSHRQAAVRAADL